MVEKSKKKVFVFMGLFVIYVFGCLSSPPAPLHLERGEFRRVRTIIKIEIGDTCEIGKEKELMARGLNNNNPGNIVKGGATFQGERVSSSDRRFKEFVSLEYGYRAMFVLLKNYVRLHGCDTVRKVINRWAPPVENDTLRYVRFVSEKTGIAADMKFDPCDSNLMVKMVSAMSWMENGIKPDETEIEKGWELANP
jgi:hypothetical protein